MQYKEPGLTRLFFLCFGVLLLASEAAEESGLFVIIVVIVVVTDKWNMTDVDCL